jgi:hypothetical protein
VLIHHFHLILLELPQHASKVLQNGYIENLKMDFKEKTSYAIFQARKVSESFLKILVTRTQYIHFRITILPYSCSCHLSGREGVFA